MPTARHHLGLLGQAEQPLSQPALWGGAEARRLAAQLERWRYQHLNEHQGQWRPVDWQLADFLDDAARKLAGRPLLPPRRTYQAVFAEGEDPPLIRRALEVLDPALPWEEVAEQARKLTEENFPGSGSACRGPGEEFLNPLAEVAPWQGTGSPSRPKRRMFLYAPLYLSSYCVNYCLYCGFRFEEPIERKHLTVEEARREAEALRAARVPAPSCWSPAISPSLSAWTTWPRQSRRLWTWAYNRGSRSPPNLPKVMKNWWRAGASEYHPVSGNLQPAPLPALSSPRAEGRPSLAGWKRLDRAAEAGMRRLGLGILLGLAGIPREDLRALLRHGRYLQDRFPEKN